jgi:alkylation response protein AidB-like acyl-CoA dehydrogenase
VTPPDLASRFRAARSQGDLDLPPPGGGQTGQRLAALADLAARDLALARLAEAHTDALAILTEAGRCDRPDSSYGVWASEAPHARLIVERTGGDGPVITGSKAFCSGLGIVDRSLVTVSTPDGPLLFDLDLSDRPGDDFFDYTLDDWVTPAFADTCTGTLVVSNLPVPTEGPIGGPGWYLQRVGFWHGALAPAACWAGGATGLVEHCIELASRRTLGPHLLAQIGVLDTARWSLASALVAAGAAVDAAPSDHHTAVVTADRLRNAVEHWVTLIVETAAAAFGPRLLAHDRWASRRVAELQLYVRQHHGPNDHERLGAHVVDGLVVDGHAVCGRSPAGLDDQRPG